MSFENVETLDPIRGYTVKIVQADGDGCDPREMDNIGVMACKHRNYVLGDEYTPERTALFTAIENHFGPISLAVVTRYCQIAFGSTVVLPLGLYDHSGISMYVGGVHPLDSGGWDSGMVGVIFDTERTRENLGIDLLWTVTGSIEKALRTEVEQYDKYLTGDVWGIMVEDNLGDEIESCWGYLGYDFAVSCADEIVPATPMFEKISDTDAMDQLFALMDIDTDDLLAEVNNLFVRTGRK